MILCKNEIIKNIQSGIISIKDKEYFPLTKENLHIGPNSIDLTLNEKLFIYKVDTSGAIDPEQDNKLVEVPFHTSFSGKKRFRLEPGILYLGSTNESTFASHFVPMLEGRSSLARMGIQIHMTAGFGDIGFSGNWTLEITCVQPTYIYINSRICQIYFLEGSSKNNLYKGKYQNANGVEMTKIMKDFE